MRNLASDDEIKSSFKGHYTTWNPTVNEAWIIAKALLALLHRTAPQDVSNSATQEKI